MQLCRVVLLTSNCISETRPAEVPQNTTFTEVRLGSFASNFKQFLHNFQHRLKKQSEITIKHGNHHLPQMKLVLISLRHSSQGMKMAEQLDSVMRLDVMHAIAKHF